MTLALYAVSLGIICNSIAIILLVRTIYKEKKSNLSSFYSQIRLTQMLHQQILDYAKTQGASEWKEIQ